MAECYRITRLDHVQLAMPAGREEEAVAFYAGPLGMTQIPKPEPLAGRGGCWFGIGAVQLHLGVEPEFRPARKAHPALAVSGIDAMASALVESGHDVRWADDVPGLRHFYVDDPFGNRIEVIAE